MPMTRTTGKTLFCVLSLIALLHVYWGFGGLWPEDTVRGLIDRVIGDSRFDAMPPMWMTLIVAFLIAAAGWIALERAKVTNILPDWIVKIGAWVLVIVFGLRGLSTYLMMTGIRETPQSMTESFAISDAWIYAPLCLLIAAGFLFLATRKTI